MTSKCLSIQGDLDSFYIRGINKSKTPKTRVKIERFGNKNVLAIIHPKPERIFRDSCWFTCKTESITALFVNDFIVGGGLLVAIILSTSTLTQTKIFRHRSEKYPRKSREIHAFWALEITCIQNLLAKIRMMHPNRLQDVLWLDVRINLDTNQRLIRLNVLKGSCPYLYNLSHR